MAILNRERARPRTCLNEDRPQIPENISSPLHPLFRRGTSERPACGCRVIGRHMASKGGTLLQMTNDEIPNDEKRPKSL